LSGNSGQPTERRSVSRMRNPAADGSSFCRHTATSRPGGCPSVRCR